MRDQVGSEGESLKKMGFW